MKKRISSKPLRCRSCTFKKCLTFVVAFLTFSANLMGQTDKKVTVNVKNENVRSVVELLQKETGLHFVYAEETLRDDQKISLNYRDTPLVRVLDDFCKQATLRYEIKRELVLLSKGNGDKTQKVDAAKVISGIVTDENGESLPGVNLFVKSNKNGTITDVDGRFSLKVSTGDLIDFTFVGMMNQTVKVTPKMSDLNVRMEADVLTLDDVVVTGYQTLSKERAAGSFATVSSKELDGKLQSSLMDRLEGAVAGMTSYRGLQIRGVSTINGTSTPLYVVDGVPYDGTIAAINPSEVTNITVLKDAAAASIYGARASNGVIVITTRSGEETGSTRVHYNGSMKFTPIYDTDYLNLMSSAEFVDFQQTLFNINPGTKNDSRYYMNEVRSLLFEHKDGKISSDELNRQLDIYRHRDRRDQAMDMFVRTPAITQQHNISFSGGSKKYTYALSLNYLQELPYDKFSESDRLGFNLKNTYRFAKWVTADLSVLGSIYRQDKESGHSGVSDITGRSTASYLLYWDEEGNDLPWYKQKSQSELDRLTGEGLMDESYNPLQEMSRQTNKLKDNYLHVNANVKFTITKDLTLNLIYSKDFGNTYSKQLYDKDSYYVRNMINNAAQITDEGIVYNIPTGGQIRETRSDKDSYTLRAQVNYNKLFTDKHRLSVIAGGERRAVKNSGTNMNRVGYDDNTLSYKLIDENKLASKITGTQALNGTFTYGSASNYAFKEDRYISFYGNASYTFDDRASLTGSIRMDQSNLFGTDPKYQYRPLWSLGAQYTILKNEDWVDRLSARMTYGINGNIPKTTGPFLTISDSGINQWTGDYSSKVTTPDNSGLRWEKTAVYNLAVDFNLFKNRLNGSIEFYNKNTTDLLHNKTMDPTLGWKSLMVNYGSMYNRGVEITLKSQNVRTKDLLWTSTVNFSYNKNKLTELEEDKTDAIHYIQTAQLRVDKPMNGLYSVRWAGLDEKGAPQAYKKNGEIVKSFANITTEDLVYSGTTAPPYSASVSNDFQYKNFRLSVLFTYYGGHVMRGVFGNYLINSGYSTNQDRLTGNFWQAPGDENDPSKAPALKMGAQTNVQNLWKAADKHIQKGDFIKLNEINFEYTLPASILRKTFIKDVRFMFQVTDIWKWVANDQGLDPEVWTGASLSPTRGQKSPATYTLGLSCNF